MPEPKDVWELTEPEHGDHVLVALTVPECQALLKTGAILVDDHYRQMLKNARIQIEWSLRDQKDIDL